MLLSFWLVGLHTLLGISMQISLFVWLFPYVCLSVSICLSGRCGFWALTLISIWKNGRSHICSLMLTAGHFYLCQTICMSVYLVCNDICLKPLLRLILQSSSGYTQPTGSGPLVLHSIGLTTHWSYTPLAMQPIGPTSHLHYKPLVLQSNGAKSH